MPPVRHVCLDTNIYVRIVTQGLPGCEVEHWTKLKEFASSGRITLLLPEVVLLEFRKQWRLVPAEIEKQTRTLTTKLLAELGEKAMYSEIRDLRQVVSDCLASYATKKEVESKSRYEEIVTFLGQKFVVHLPIEPDALLRTERRVLSGGLADPRKQSRADCMIVELLSAHFRERKIEGHTLLLCTENTSDFAVKVGEEFALHPTIADDLPPANLFSNLKSVVEFIEAQKELLAVPAEKVEEAAREEDVERATVETPKRRVALGELRDRARKPQRGMFDTVLSEHANDLFHAIQESKRMQKLYEQSEYVRKSNCIPREEAEMVRLLQQESELQRQIRDVQEQLKRYGGS